MPEPVTYAVLVCDDELVRKLTGPSLWYSKLLVSRAPVIVLDGLPRDTAEAAVADLVAAGAEAGVRAGSWTGLPDSADPLG
ncbi:MULTISPECIES: ribosomal protein L7/L12 [unclassified Streptomyces]|uniref:ribosomal protein L7/L12 n=1 Tax=unclassified Streptomyces TaxID=2593676 RepID=UPI0036F0A0D6